MARTRFPHIRKTPIKATYDDEYIPPLKLDHTFQTLSAHKKQFLYYILMQPVKPMSNAKAWAKAHHMVLGQDIKKNNAQQNAATFLKRPDIKALFDKINTYHINQHEDLYNKIVNEETYLAFSDAAEYFDDAGRCIVNPKKLPLNVRRAIKSWKVVETMKGTKYEVVLYDKGRALDSLKKVIGMDAAQKVYLSGQMTTNNVHDVKVEINHKLNLASLSDKEIKSLMKITKKLRSKK